MFYVRVLHYTCTFDFDRFAFPTKCVDLNLGFLIHSQSHVSTMHTKYITHARSLKPNAVLMAFVYLPFGILLEL